MIALIDRGNPGGNGWPDERPFISKTYLGSLDRFDWFALAFLEALQCGKMRAMTKEITPRKPTTRRYRKQEKDQAVRQVFELRKALGTAQGAVVRVADQLGYGTESLPRGLPRLWVMLGM
jgi:hypothetical protein